MTVLTGRHYLTGDPVRVTVSGPTVAAVEPWFDAPAAKTLPWVAPAFIDLQLNGYGGHDFNVGAWSDEGEVSDEIAPIYELAARTGTVQLMPTVTTNSLERMEQSLAALAHVLDADPALQRRTPGVHVEGPFLSSDDGPRGAHPRSYILDPDWEIYRRLQDAAGGRIRLFTLAPELEGGLEFIERLGDEGVVVALGHTAASPAQIADAVSAGATVSTHLGNGAHGVLPRHPNYIWEQLADDRLYATIIADGHHLPPSVVKVMARAKGRSRLALVSDAVSIGGLAPGLYKGGEREVLPSGRIVLAGTPYLAGAGHLLDTGVANLIRFAGVSLADAVTAASTLPAEILGLTPRKGRLEPGADADLIVFTLPDDGPARILRTLSFGEVIHAG